MIKWRCSNCGYVFEKDKPPKECPSCKEKCTFTDVTCYTPECGGEKNIDPQLFDRKEKS